MSRFAFVLALSLGISFFGFASTASARPGHGGGGHHGGGGYHGGYHGGGHPGVHPPAHYHPPVHHPVHPPVHHPGHHPGWHHAPPAHYRWHTGGRYFCHERYHSTYYHYLWGRRCWFIPSTGVYLNTCPVVTEITVVCDENGDTYYYNAVLVNVGAGRCYRYTDCNGNVRDIPCP
jgi:hypothetical protein